MSEFRWPARVYWEDTDGGAVVYYANYLRFLERARTEWLRQYGHSQAELARSPGILFAVVSIQVDYRAPALLRHAIVEVCARTNRPMRFGRALDLGCGTGLAGIAFRDCREHLEGVDLSPEARAVIEAADTLFVASAHAERGVDASHRGGPPGFVWQAWQSPAAAR